jgi:hypothetical protein
MQTRPVQCIKLPVAPYATYSHPHSQPPIPQILKTFVFELMNRFGTLFYLAFVKPNTDVFGASDYCIPFSEEIISQSDAPIADNCFGTVGYALLAAFGSALVVDNINEVLVPRFNAWATRRANAVKSNVIFKGATDAVGAATNAVLDVVGMANEDENSEAGPVLMKSPCEDDFYLSNYDGTMDDFLEIAILFGVSVYWYLCRYFSHWLGCTLL